MTSPLVEVTVKWNGVATVQNVGNVARVWDGDLVVAAAKITPAEEAMWESISMQTGSPIVNPVEGSFRIKGTTSTVSSVANALRDLLDDWRLLGLRYNPFDGPVDLEVTRKNASGVDVVTVLRAQAGDLPAPKIVTRGEFSEGIWAVSDPRQAQYFYPVRFRAAYGLWLASTVEDDAATATTGGVTLTTTNTGVRDRPCRITLGTVTGSPTTATLFLSGNPYLRITSPSTGQYFDFGHTTPGEYDGTASINQALGDLRVPAGATAWTWQVDGGTGTVPMTIEWYPEFGSW